MAARQGYPEDRTYKGRGNTEVLPYVFGNVAAQPESEPGYHGGSSGRTKKKVSRQVRKNRNHALSMNSAYMLFLSIAAVMVLVVCVNYVRLQSRVTEYSKKITVMKAELVKLKEENDAKYNAVTDSVNLDQIRERAQNELGMVYASPEQIVAYDNPATDYVKQYEDIPEDGVLARSGKSGR